MRGLLAIALVLALAEPAQAIPAFARRYGVPCATCHSAITRRNEFGDAFRKAGYRWPGLVDEEAGTAPIVQAVTPLAIGQERSIRLIDEVVAGERTRPEVVAAISSFADLRLGKGVVPCKDRPGFIANRIGTFGALFTIKTMLDDGYSIEEVDKMTGPAVGRPKSATFRTFDIVGLDVFTHVIKNLFVALPEDEEREMFVVPEVLAMMVQRGLLGNKTKAGFYRKQKGEGDKREIWALDTATLDYRPLEKVKLPSLDMAKNIEDLPERVKALTWGKDRVGAFLWKTLSRVLAYSARRIPEIADNVVEVDRAMRWGFGMKEGPFELWQAAGWAAVARWIREELGNRAVRIVLRTAQPGQAPPREVVRQYEIDDYRTKPELTFETLHVLTVTALRHYQTFAYTNGPLLALFAALSLGGAAAGRSNDRRCRIGVSPIRSSAVAPRCLTKQ